MSQEEIIEYIRFKLLEYRCGEISLTSRELAEEVYGNIYYQITGKAVREIAVMYPSLKVSGEPDGSVIPKWEKGTIDKYEGD